MHNPDDYVTAPSGTNYTDRERQLTNDHTLPQPERNNIPWIIGISTLAGVILLATWIIIASVASISIFITIFVCVVIIGPVVWLIERGNRHPH